MENVHENEADGVVQSRQKTFYKGREAAVRNHHLDRGRANRQKAAAKSGIPHLAILFAIVGDVMLAGFSGPFDNFFGE